LAAILIADAVKGRTVRLMFQEEARFGRMVRIRRCWPPTPPGRCVDNGYERQFIYVYGAVSPVQGEMDWMISPKMNTEQMNQFLAQVSQTHSDELIVMIVDGASSHRSTELRIPENTRLQRLPGYSPEINTKSMSGISLAKRSSPTESSNPWKASSANSTLVCLD